nr:MAG TPA: hypothetical protein [Caudoviricetes sp.]
MDTSLIRGAKSIAPLLYYYYGPVERNGDRKNLPPALFICFLF